jgi:hypothetical protein
MSEGRSQRSVASSAQHRQEAEVVATEERERAATRLTMAELAAARVEVEAAAAADAARAAAAELEALRASSTGSSVSADDDRDNEFKLAREAAREQAAQWAAAHPQGRRGGNPDGRRRAGGAPGWATRGGRAPNGGGSSDRRGRTGGWVDGDRGFTGGAALPPGQVLWSPWDSGHCQGRRSRRRVTYPHQDQLRRVGHGDEGTAPGAAHVGSSSVRRRRLLQGSTGAGCPHCCSPV